ncbi:hypothetical protein ACFXJ8_07465 [Nonomuraea sp. NPDC059194]
MDIMKDAAGVQRVFGEPVTQGEVTVIRMMVLGVRPATSARS